MSTENIKRLPIEGVTPPRYIDPNASLEKQHSILEELIKNPPENSRVISISSALAEWILRELNPQNRNKRPAKIKRFAADMDAGKWELTGDTIKFGKSGLLRDGQNRLTACVRCGVAFRTHVVFGIPDRAFAVIDTNAVRTNSDTLNVEGVPHSKIVAQAIRWLLIYAVDPIDRGRSFENSVIREYYREKIDHARMEWAVGNAIAVNRSVPAGALAAHLYMFQPANAKATTKFADDLREQQRGGRKLAEKLDRLRKQNMGRVNEVQINALTIQAWNAYRRGEALTMAMLNWNENKEYPAIG